MKHVLYFTLLLLLPQMITSQTTSGSCDTLVLLNGKKFPVIIDSIVGEIVFYKLCQENATQQYSLNPKLATETIKVNAKSETASQKIIINDPSIPKVGLLKKWIFKHKLKKITRSLLAGQEIKITYLELEDFKHTKGKLEKITKDKLVLLTDQGLKRFRTEDIVKIPFPAIGRFQKPTPMNWAVMWETSK